MLRIRGCVLARQQLKVNAPAISHALPSIKEVVTSYSMSSQQAKVPDTDSNEKISGSPPEIKGARAKRRLLLPQLSYDQLRSSCAEGFRLSFVQARRTLRAKRAFRERHVEARTRFRMWVDLVLLANRPRS